MYMNYTEVPKMVARVASGFGGAAYPRLGGREPCVFPLLLLRSTHVLKTCVLLVSNWLQVIGRTSLMTNLDPAYSSPLPGGIRRLLNAAYNPTSGIYVNAGLRFHFACGLS